MYRKNGHGDVHATPDAVVQRNLGIDLNRNFGAVPGYVPDIYRMDLGQPTSVLATRYDLDPETVRALQRLPDGPKQLQSLHTCATWGLDDNGSSPDPVSNTYRGPYQNSEEETQIVAKFMIEHPLSAHVMHHAYGNQILCAGRPRIVDGRAYLTTFTRIHQDACVRMARHIALVGVDVDGLEVSEDIRSDRLTYSLADDAIGYAVNGDTDDFGYLVHSSRLSKRPYIGITVETGNRLVDQFYPSVCEMVDLVANGLEYNRRLHQYVIRQELRTPRALQHVISRLVESLKKMK